MIREAPSLASVCAYTFPIPEPEPVMIATLPENRIFPPSRRLARPEGSTVRSRSIAPAQPAVISGRLGPFLDRATGLVTSFPDTANVVWVGRPVGWYGM